MGRPDLAHRVEDLEREAQAVLDRAAILVRAAVGQRRDEAREQVAVRAVEFEHVEAGALAALGRVDELRLDQVHVGAGQLARHLAVREVGNRRRRADIPGALIERPVDALPHQLGRAFAPGMTELQAELRGRVGVDEIDDPLPGRLLLVVPQARAAERDARLGRDAGHLGEDQPGAADGARAVMHEVPVARNAVLGRVHVHRRHDDPVVEHHVAQAEAAGTSARLGSSTETSKPFLRTCRAKVRSTASTKSGARRRRLS